MIDHRRAQPISDPVQPTWRPDEFGLRSAFVLSGTVVALLIGALVVLSRPRDVLDVLPAMTIQLIELPPATAAAPEPPAVSPEPSEAAAAIVDGAVQLIAPDASAASETDEAETVASRAIMKGTVAVTVPPPAPAPAALVLPELPTAPRVRGPATTTQPRLAPSRSPPRPLVPTQTAVTRGLTAPLLALAPPEPGRQPLPQSALLPDTTSGIGSYRAGLHIQVERNVTAGAPIEIEPPGRAGTAVIEAVIGPDGGVISARIARGSGNRTIDQAALAAVRRGGYRPFGAHMPEQPITISVPITIAPS